MIAESCPPADPVEARAAVVASALLTEWYDSVERQIVASPEEHVARMTAAALDALDRMTAADASPRAIAAVLAEHYSKWSGIKGLYACACGWGPSTPDLHRAHAAAAITESLAGERL